MYWLLLGVLGVWRITHLLQAEDGPWRIVLRLRRFTGNAFWGELLDCFYCLSLWIAAPFALELGRGWKERLLLWPALSAAAILLERITVSPVAAFSEDLSESIQQEEDSHVVLRQSKDDSQVGRGSSSAA
jgi:hypothetical protein